MMHRRTLIWMMLAVLASACQPKVTNTPTVLEARASATAPGATVGAVYMEISTPTADALLGASTPVATEVQMHTNSEEGGMMKMRPLQTVELRPDQPFVFEPGGAHFMLVGLQAPLVADSRFPLTLRFKNAGDIVVDVAVLPIAP